LNLLFVLGLLCQDPDITELVKRLGSADFAEQGRAAKALEHLGPRIVGKLRSVAETPEVQAWCRRIADRLERNERRFAPALEKLGSADDKVKDAAELEFLRAGPAAIPYLKQAMGADNQNLRLRAETLVRVLSNESAITAELWGRLESGGWLAVSFRALSVPESVLNDDKVGADFGTPVEIAALPMPWSEVAALEVRVRPVSASQSFLVLGAGGPASWHALGVQSKEPWGIYGLHAAGKDKAQMEHGAPLPRTEDYLLRIENVGKRWKFRVGASEVKSVEEFPAPSAMRLSVNDGRAEFFDLKVRKK
jgi:hypothetical protein